MKTLAGLALAIVCIFSAQARAQEDRSGVASDNALAYLTIDIDRTGGWIAQVKGGYQWKIFKGVGIELREGNAGTTFSRSQNYTKSGLGASVSLGYSFGPKFPLTFGLELGYGPKGEFDMTSRTQGGVLASRERISIFNLDLTADYEFKNCSRWTPFIGVTGGVAFISHRASAQYVSNAGVYHQGRYENQRRYNFMTGARIGTRYAINDRVTLSLYGSYNYMGKVPGHSFAITDGATNTFEARTKKVTAHSLDAKVGLKISF